MSSTKQIVEQPRDVAAALTRAMGTSFGREVTAYLTDAYLVAGCCVGVVHRKRSINPARQDGIYFQEAGAEAGEQFQGSSAS